MLSSLSSDRPFHGTGVRPKYRGYAVRGSTAHQPTGSSSRYATSPLVDEASGSPQLVCSRRSAARSGSVVVVHIQPRVLNRWQWHCPASLVPKTVCRSSQLASFAGRKVSALASMGSMTGRLISIADNPLPGRRVYCVRG